jgi:hypothetical protein
MIQIIQTPGDINAAYGINAVTLAGIEVPNQRYKLEVWNGDNNLLIASLVITPNQYGNGIVDIKNVLQTLIKPSLFDIEKSTTIQDAFNETKEYILKGYIVNILDIPIDEDIAETSILLTTGGRKDAWSVFYSIPTTSLTDLSYTKKANDIKPNPDLLGNISIKYIELTRKNYYTISYKNDFTEYTLYPYINEDLQTPIVLTNTLPDAFPSAFITIPIGFKNIQFVLPIGTTSYFVNVKNEWFYFNIIEEDCSFDAVQLSWLNSYGYRDYYTFTKRVDRTTNVSRNTYNRSIVDYNFVGLQTTRGESGDVIYSQGIESEYIIRTDYIDKELSEYFENLIISPNVRALIKNQWYDIKPLSNQWRLQSFITDRLYQFEYSFKIAANINSQRG